MSDDPVLLIDLGNTSLKWSLLRCDGLGPVNRRPYRGTALVSLLDEAWSGMETPKRILMASVGHPEAQRDIREWVASCWNAAVERQVARKQAHGVTLSYDEPERFGVDRWLALIAAHRRYAGPVCILDCGTAVTIDALDGRGFHLGGFILPGLRMMRDALHQRTNMGPLGDADAIDGLARDTPGAVVGGALWACVATTERVARRVRADLGVLPVIIVTGGDGQRVQSEFDLESHFEPDLVMQGLADVAREKSC